MNGRLIITGDDYGLCASVNRAIEECLAAGAMGATCVMANMPLYAEAAHLRSQFPNASLGVHWNITQGRPVLNPAELPTLVDADGNFSTELRRRWLTRRIDREEIRAELHAQYYRFTDVAGAGDFWNTHQNAHVFPGLFQLFVQVARELNIPAMRSHRRLSVPQGTSLMAYLLTHPNYWFKGEVIARWSDAAEEHGMRMPAGRVYLPGHQPNTALLQDIAERLPWRTISAPVEWVVHPAVSAEDKLLGSLTESRKREHQFLCQAGLLSTLKNLGLRPVSFAALKPALAGGSRVQGSNVQGQIPVGPTFETDATRKPVR